MNDSHTADFDEVRAAERDLIAAHRANRGVQGERVVGLALSGGGIRSAAFGLGVLQALDAGGVFKHIDYLSSVSGGGYIGSSLTWFLRNGSRAFPFGHTGRATRSDQSDDPGAILDYLRQHRDYLSPRAGFNAESFDPAATGPNPRAGRRGGVSLLSLTGVVINNMVVSTLVYLALLVVFFFALNILDAAALPLKAVVGAVQRRQVDTRLAAWHVALLIGVLLIAAVVVMSLVRSVMSFFAQVRHTGENSHPRSRGWGYRARLRLERTLGKLWFVAFVSFVVGSVPLLSLLLECWMEEAWTRGALGGVAMVVGAWLGSVVFNSRGTAASRPRSRTGALISMMGVPLGGLLLVYGMMLVAYTVSVSIADSGHVELIYAVLAAALLLGALADLNALSSHTVYRDRLMEAFLPGHAAVRQNQWRPAAEADCAALDGMCGRNTSGPYHLINATVITVDSARSRFRGRGGDSFVLSPLFCGSEATGWKQTPTWLPNGITLATAMAISGAANPETGGARGAPTRSRGVSMFMALLNLRLGYWAANPNPQYPVRWRRWPPNFLYPGLVQGLFGADLSETQPYVELSAGGHFENLGIYELVRRGVDVIIVSDGGGDANRSFCDLTSAIERVRADFHVAITFSDPARDLSGLLPQTASDDSTTAGFGLAKRGYAVGKIAYPTKEGVLVYLKAVMTPGLSAEIFSYKAEHPSFPDQSTADQLFDESEFEAYRELGYHVTAAMLNAEPIRDGLTTAVTGK